MAHTPDDLEAERERAVKFIDYATNTLKGPMSNVERAWMVADRKDAREYLAEVDAKIAARAALEAAKS
jgi:hypothetical protein